jgi:hypothetical protein
LPANQATSHCAVTAMRLRNGQVDDVEEHPDEPGRKAADAEPPAARDGGGPADGGGRSLVEIPERVARPACPVAADLARNEASHLDRGRRDAGDVATSALEVRKIADDEDLAVTGDGAVGLDRDAERAAERRRLHASRPEDRGGLDALVLQPDAVRIDVDDPAAQPDLHAETFDLPARLLREVAGKAGQHLVVRLDENDARAARVDAAEIILQRLVHHAGHRAGQLHPCRARADHDEGEQPGAPRRFRFPFGALERAQKASPDLERILDRLEPGRVHLPFIVAEVRVPQSRRDDEVVVIEGSVVDVDPALPRVDAGHFTEVDLEIALAPQNVTQRCRHIGRRERGCRDFVQEGLEQMKIAPIEECDAYRCLRE